MGDVITTTKHSHDQGENKVKAAKLRGAMKEYATAARGKSSQIIADNVVLVWFPLTPLCNIGSGIAYHLGYNASVVSLSNVDLLLSPKTCFASKDYCHTKIFLSLIHNI